MASRPRTMATKTREPPVDGVLLLDKPQGITSHDLVSGTRRAMGQREVGHTGTLDPMATGLMVVTLGRATRISRFLEATLKHYEGTITLGRATDTMDAEGQTTHSAPVPELGEEAVAAVFASMVGPLAQVVPAYSAVKVDGERLYQKARRGEVVEAPVRTIEVGAFELLGLRGPELDFRVRVSKGTYVRSLAVEVGARLHGLPAHLSRLRRTQVGEFRVEEAQTLDGLDRLKARLRTPAEALAHFPALEVDAQGAKDVRHGRPLLARQVPATVPGGWVRVLDGPELIAVAEVRLDPEARAAAPGERAVAYACVLANP